MFHEISREDVFRLETRSLWLRWPMASDAPAVPAGGCDVMHEAPEAASGDPYRAAGAVVAWREANAAGQALHLTLTGRGADRTAIGTVELTPLRGAPEDCGLRLRLWLAASARGQGFATETVQAVVDAGFMLTGTPLVAASARVLDPALRRVLEKSGFGFCGSGLDPGPDGRGLVASDRFRLDRKAWTSLRSWRTPEALRRRDATPEAVVPCPG